MGRPAHIPWGLVDTGWMAMLFTDSGDSDGETEWGGMTLV